MNLIYEILAIPLIIFAIFWIEVVECTYWRFFGKHKLSVDEIAYNDKIEVICKAFDDQYKKMISDDDNLIIKTDIPYSLAKKILNIQFDIVDFSEANRRRAMREINALHARNSTHEYEYEFALGGRSDCFLLLTFLRETKYTPDPKPRFVWK